MRPFETFPGTNGPSNFTLNHSPNSRWSVSARQTRDTGAFNSIVFSIRLDICNYLVAFQYVRILSICNRFVSLVSDRLRSTEKQYAEYLSYLNTPRQYLSNTCTTTTSLT